ncbi:biotin synthase BioB [Clostridium sp. Ade.TY]|uniref:biotin synthase BioB n=1 Tax=Clostridium sp. Ade.TY TaxID=1391647 RepID=UPI000419FA4B|nr:biotin synthase BioB [Clostridium sp. Ade.TY]
MSFCEQLKLKVINGYNVKKDEALRLFLEPSSELFKCANEIRKVFCGDEVHLCSIINGKSGKCSENCKYCAQSVHFKTNIKEYELLEYKNILDVAKDNEKNGVNRFSIVTAGRGASNYEIDKLSNYYRLLSEQCNISLCASHGIIGKESLIKLKEAGVERYHHNIETSKNYYNKICTTHSFEDRIKTIKYAKEVGLEVCSGGIIGMGETIEDRIDMAIELRNLKIKSIPINVLIPIDGTPFESLNVLSEEEILKTISIFRFINKDANIRLAAGRSTMKNNGENAFNVGANATITGNLLTTCGNKITDDLNMIYKIGLKVCKKNMKLEEIFNKK